MTVDSEDEKQLRIPRIVTYARLQSRLYPLNATHLKNEANRLVFDLKCMGRLKMPELWERMAQYRRLAHLIKTVMGKTWFGEKYGVELPAGMSAPRTMGNPGVASAPGATFNYPGVSREEPAA